MIKPLCVFALLVFAGTLASQAEQPPYDAYPEAEPPYYRVRYKASEVPGELIFAVKYTVWIPDGVKELRGVVVHQHGCGEGSCKSGLTGAFDLHWQALAAKHDCALLAPSYEQPQKADCQMWCDPRNGSGQAFQKSLTDLGKAAGHPELATVPWALWGHSGGGHWCGGMVMLHPDRVAAAWLRSGVPLFEENPDRPAIKTHALPTAALKVPIMCNPGTKEGVTVKDGRFARVWPANEKFFAKVRSAGGLVGVAVDPRTAHECGNQRYLAIRWLDECLRLRLPKQIGQPLRAVPTGDHWLAPIAGFEAKPHRDFEGEPLASSWFVNPKVAKWWMQYVKDTNIPDDSPPPAPSDVKLTGGRLTWNAKADTESGIAHFIIRRDGEFLARVPKQGNNRFGRDIFQGLQYSDTPNFPLVKMEYQIENNQQAHRYSVVSVNTVGLKSKASKPAEK